MGVTLGAVRPEITDCVPPEPLLLEPLDDVIDGICMEGKGGKVPALCAGFG